MGVLRGIEKEFQHWLVEDERELRLRIDLSRQQLRTQLETLKLQARWLHPYLRVAEQLTASSSSSPALVTAFNTALFEVTLLALLPVDVSESIQRGELPEWMEHHPHRDYFSVVVVELFSRSAPLRVEGSSHAHRGKVEIRGTSYALHQAELGTLRRQYERDELGELMRHLGVAIPANLEDLLLDLEENAAERPGKPSRTTEDDANPFTALFSLLVSFLRWLGALVRPDAARTGLEPDSEIEQRLRQHAAVLGQRQCQQLHAQLKSSLGMTLSEPERLAV